LFVDPDYPPGRRRVFAAAILAKAGEAVLDFPFDIVEPGMAGGQFLGRQVCPGGPKHFRIAQAARQGEANTLEFLHKAFVPIDQPVIGIE
jgi:hypothetical protein